MFNHDKAWSNKKKEKENSLLNRAIGNRAIIQIEKCEMFINS